MKTFSIHVLIVVAALCALLAAPKEAHATCTTQVVTQLGNFVQYTGSCTDDNEVIITTADLSQYDACSLVSLTGAVDVFTSLNGTDYITAPRSLQDFGAADNNPVLVTAALREYGFVGKWRRLQILQNGATDAEVVLNCWKL